MLLRVELNAELLNQRQLRFEEIDVLFLVGGQRLEQVHRDPVVDLVAIAGSLEIELAGTHLRRQIALEDLLYASADPELVQRLHVRVAIEEQDANDEHVSVAHFLDRFFTPCLGEIPVAPVVKNAVVEPVLIDRGELMPQRLVEVVDHSLFATHTIAPHSNGRGIRGPRPNAIRSLDPWITRNSGENN